MSKLSEKKIIAITGVIGVGKSTFVRVLKERGYPILDLDAINFSLQQINQPGYQAILDAFGVTMLKEDGSLDRYKLSQQVFSNREEKEKLEAIMHPLIFEEMLLQILRIEATLIFVEVPLLFEVNWESKFDEIWVVASDEVLIMERLKKNRNMSEEDILKRLKNQLPQEYKIKHATRVFYNTKSEDDLIRQIDEVLEKVG